jgi:RIO-like serine/threonine protein kinase
MASIPVIIDGQTYTFKRVSLYGRNGSYFIDSTNTYFMKKSSTTNIMKEATILTTLNNEGCHFPRLIQQSRDYMITSFNGVSIDEYNIPENARIQLDEICAILRKHSISHNDIGLRHILVSPEGIISLCDFGAGSIRCGDMQHDKDKRRMGYFLNKITGSESRPIHRRRIRRNRK